MNRAELLRKLRALAADPAASPNEREVARQKADQIEAASADEGQPYWQDELNQDVLDHFNWLKAAVDLASGGSVPYSLDALHVALYVRPDGTMGCRCHGGMRIEHGTPALS